MKNLVLRLERALSKFLVALHLKAPQVSAPEVTPKETPPKIKEDLSWCLGRTTSAYPYSSGGSQPLGLTTAYIPAVKPDPRPRGLGKHMEIPAEDYNSKGPAFPG